MTAVQVHGNRARAWQPCKCMATVQVHGNRASAWQPCKCMATVQVHGNRASAWQPCKCMATVQVHGNRASAWQPCKDVTSSAGLGQSGYGYVRPALRNVTSCNLGRQIPYVFVRVPARGASTG